MTYLRETNIQGGMKTKWRIKGAKEGRQAWRRITKENKKGD